MIHETIAHLAVPLSNLRPYRLNPRVGDVDAIAESLQHNGQYRPVVANKRTGEVLAGNHTFKAATSLGWPDIAVTWVDVDDNAAAKIVAVDNRANDLATYDDKILVELLQSMPELDGTLYREADLKSLVESMTEHIPIDDDENDEADNNVPALPDEPITKLGDVWLLGEHRIMCGDCRDFSTVDQLMNGRKVNVAFTSPPYASQRKYDESSGFVPIRPDAYVEWFEDVQANVRSVLADDGSFFVNIKEHCEDGQRHLYVKDLTIAHVRNWGWRFVDELCWTRSGVPGRWNNRFKNGFEPIFHFSASPTIRFRPERVGHESKDLVSYDASNPTTHSGFISSAVGGRFDGIALPSNVLKIGSAYASSDRAHTAEFPVKLPQWFIRAYSDEGDAVFDPFMGSGSTLIAAHREGRIGYGTEISPRYADVICRRFQEATGIVPILESTGEAHDFTKGDGT